MTSSEKVFRHDNVCPYCDHKLTAATHVMDRHRIPVSGDFTVCIKCAEISKFNDHMKLEKCDLTDCDNEEMADLLHAKMALVRGGCSLNTLMILDSEIEALKMSLRSQFTSSLSAAQGEEKAAELLIFLNTKINEILENIKGHSLLLATPQKDGH
jgi:hypothetical protein